MQVEVHLAVWSEKIVTELFLLIYLSVKVKILVTKSRVIISGGGGATSRPFRHILIESIVFVFDKVIE